MEKIKSKLHRRSADDSPGSPQTTRTGALTGEGCHLTGTYQPVDETEDAGVHPIYDEFTGHSQPGPIAEPLKTTEQPPHFSNTSHTSNLNHPPKANTEGVASTPSGGLTTPSALNPPSAPSEGASTASIKSGVVGFPQDQSDTHAALEHMSAERRLEQTNMEGVLPQSHVTSLPEESLHSGRDMAARAGMARVGAAAIHNLSRKREEEPSGNAEQPVAATPQLLTKGSSAQDFAFHPQQLPERRHERAEEPKLTTVTDRSFRLAGGVKRGEHSEGGQPITTSEREPGTKDRDMGAVDGRKALTGAAAGAAATAATTSTRSSSSPGEDNSHPHRGHTSTGEPLGFDSTISRATYTEGPRITDTADQLDPHLHVPGEFPDPTPTEETAQPSFSATGASPQTARALGPAQKPESEQHHGHDAALVGGRTSAAAGLYAGSQRDREPDTGPASNTIGPHKSNIANVFDPRVQPNPDLQKQHVAESATGPASSTIGPHRSNIANIVDTRVQPDPALQKHHHAGRTEEDPASATVGPHKANIANVLDPRVLPDPEKQKGHVTTGPHQSDTLNRMDPKVDPRAHQNQQPYGRDTAIVGGVEVAGLGSYEAEKHHDREPPGIDGATIPAGPNPYTSTRLDPRVDSRPVGFEDQRFDPNAPNKPTQHHGRDAALTAGAVGGAGLVGHEAANKMPPKQQVVPPQTTHQSPLPAQARKQTIWPEAHDGQDAGAATGGVSTAAYGAHEVVKHYGEQPSTQPSASMNNQRYNPTVPGAHEPTPSQGSQHHYERDAAIAGGIGVVGAGAYTATQPRAEQPIPQGNQQPYTAQQPFSGHQRYDSMQESTDKQHHQRNVAVGSAAVAGADTGASYEDSTHERDKAEKGRLAQQKEFERKQKEQEKALKQQQKEIEHKRAKEQQQQNKLAVAEDKKHQKEVAMAEAKHQRAIEKEEARQQKELDEDREKEEGKDRKHHLFGFLHREKKDKQGDSTSENGSPRHSKEYAAASEAVDAGAYEGGLDSDGSGKKRHNKLHKDPPPGHPAHEFMEAEKGRSGEHQHMGIDGPIGLAGQVSGDQ